MSAGGCVLPYMCGYVFCALLRQFHMAHQQVRQHHLLPTQHVSVAPSRVHEHVLCALLHTILEDCFGKIPQVLGQIWQIIDVTICELEGLEVST